MFQIHGKLSYSKIRSSVNRAKTKTYIMKTQWLTSSMQTAIYLLKNLTVFDAMISMVYIMICNALSLDWENTIRI